jgi:signal transduction histidine kinase/CheY-like chemotaxis protein
MTQDIAPFGFAVIFILFALYWYRSRLDSLKTAALSDVFESYSDAVTLVGINEIIEESNETFYAYFPDFDLTAGQTPAINLLQYFNHLVADEQSQQVLAMLMNRQAPTKSEITLKLANDEVKTFAVVWQDVLNNRGRLAGWLLILNDVSEYRQMISEINEQNQALEKLRIKAEAASEAKTTFLASMSHEMRTPLNAIIGLSELTLHNDLDPKSRNNILKVNESGTGLLKVINDILDISKIESGNFELVPVVYKTAGMISEIVNINKVRIGDKPVKLMLNISPDLPFELLGDELRVRQILSNLLSNAIKYTNDGTVVFAVTIERDTASVSAPTSGNLCVTVKDTGIGIKDDDLKSLFAQYHQVDMKKNRSVEGTGLGLAIVNNLVELMGGSINVVSEYGKGSKFTAIIPQQIACATAIGRDVALDLELMRYADSQTDRGSIKHTQLSNKRVLVVDDVDVNLEVAKGMLEPYGLQIDTVTSGQQSVDLVRAGKPRYDLIFMDHMMPQMDGVEAVRLMRTSIDTDYAKSVPVIALTANAMVGSREMFFKEGFQDFLAKPINSVELDNLICRWLG